MNMEQRTDQQIAMLRDLAERWQKWVIHPDNVAEIERLLDDIDEIEQGVKLDPENWVIFEALNNLLIYEHIYAIDRQENPPNKSVLKESRELAHV